MKLIKRLKEKLLSLLFGKTRINKVVIEKTLLENIMKFAKVNHPNEFIAFLGGRINKDELILTNLLYQQYFPSTDSVFTRINLPMTAQSFGTVHSHPIPSNKPSKQDLFLFGKQGMVHMIIKYPYRLSDIAVYNFKGERINFEIKE